ncbi:protein [Bifidobacterium bifidum]|nr:protein [Bifidobacterium bifidum]
MFKRIFWVGVGVAIGVMAVTKAQAYAHLSDFHSYGTVKVYYDGGQQIVTDALRGGIEYALSIDAIVYRDASPRDYRLEQVADFLCTLELTCEKFRNGEQTETDNKFLVIGNPSESIILSRSAGKDWNHKFGSAHIYSGHN